MVTTNRKLASQVRSTTTRASRTRVGTAMSAARRYAVMDAVVRRINAAAGLVGCAQYLADGVGADRFFVAKYSPVFGKAAKKAFIAEYGVEPPETAVAWCRRMLRTAYAYTTDQLAVLDKAARNYKRTAQLLGA